MLASAQGQVVLRVVQVLSHSMSMVFTVMLTNTTFPAMPSPRCSGPVKSMVTSTTTMKATTIMMMRAMMSTRVRRRLLALFLAAKCKFRVAALVYPSLAILAF